MLSRFFFFFHSILFSFVKNIYIYIYIYIVYFRFLFFFLLLLFVCGVIQDLHSRKDCTTS